MPEPPGNNRYDLSGLKAWSAQLSGFFATYRYFLTVVKTLLLLCVKNKKLFWSKIYTFLLTGFPDIFRKIDPTSN